MEKRQQFTFYRSFYDALNDVPEEFRCQAVMAMIRYALDGEEPQGLESHGRIFFKLARPTLDAARRMAGGGKKGKPGKRSAKGMQNEKEDENEKEGEKKGEKENEIEDERLTRERAFERFWELYPVKIDRDGAWQAYLQCGQEPRLLLESLEAWKRCEQWKEDGGRYIPKPVKWLAQKHFLHAPAALTPVGASGELGQAELEAIQRMLAEG